MRLYELTEAFARLVERQEQDEFAEISAEEIDRLFDTLEAKLANCAAYVKDQKAEALKFEEEGKRLRRRQATAEERARWMQQYILDCLNRSNLTRLTAGPHALRVQANGRPQVSFSGDLADLAEAHPEFIKIIPAVAESRQVDPEAVIAHYKAHPEQPTPEGLHLVRGVHLRIG